MMHMEGIPEEFKPAAKRAAGSTWFCIVVGLVIASTLAVAASLEHPEQWGRPAIGFCMILVLHIAVAISAHRNSQRLLAAMRHAPDLARTGIAQPVHVVTYNETNSLRKPKQYSSLNLRSEDAPPDTPFTRHRIIAPMTLHEIPVPVAAELFEDDDTRVVRLPDGTLILIPAPKGDILPSHAWLTPPPRPIPWLVWAQMLSLNGTIAIMLPIAAMIWILVLKVAITEWPYTHLPLLFLPGMAIAAALGWFFTWLSVVMPIMNLQYYRRLRDAAFGRARLLEAQPFGIQRPGQKVSLHLRIRDENGTEYEQSLITQAPHRWQPNTEIPVLFDPHQRLEPIKLENFTGLKSYYGSLDFCKIDAKGRIVTDAKAVVTSVICLAIGLAPGYGAVILALKAIGH